MPVETQSTERFISRRLGRSAAPWFVIDSQDDRPVSSGFRSSIEADAEAGRRNRRTALRAQLLNRLDEKMTRRQQIRFNEDDRMLAHAFAQVLTADAEELTAADDTAKRDALLNIAAVAMGWLEQIEVTR